MGFIITTEIAKAIKEYCEYQEFAYDAEKQCCKYCVFNSPKKCLLYDELIGFPSDWNV